MPSHHIRVTFRPVSPDPDGESEGGHALFMTVDAPDPEDLLGLLEAAVTRFKAEQMNGPPDTRFMLITLVGELSAGEFAQAWQAAITNDLPARALLGTLHTADVVQSDERGRVCGQASLITAPIEPDELARSDR